MNRWKITKGINGRYKIIPVTVDGYELGVSELFDTKKELIKYIEENL
jgi:hypothetical protein